MHIFPGPRWTGRKGIANVRFIEERIHHWMTRWGCSPERAVVGTSSGPILSCSTRGAVVIAPYSAGFGSFTVISV
jgi:hypothetical protein